MFGDLIIRGRSSLFNYYLHKILYTPGITLTIHSGFWIDLGMELVTETEQVVAAVLTAAKLVVEIVIGVGIAVFIAGLLVWLGPAFAVFAV